VENITHCVLKTALFHYLIIPPHALRGSNPQTLGPMTSMITITPPRMTTAVPLSTALYKLGTFITGTILANKKYLQHSGTDFKLEKRNISGKVQWSISRCEKINFREVQFCHCLHTARHKTE
jgi:hypothetical protein